MIYTEKAKVEIECVLDAFKGYIEPNPAMEVCWSEKLGYILIKTAPIADHLDVDAEIIDDSEHLCKNLVEEICMDVFEISDRDHELGDTSKLEYDEIVRRVSPHLNQLPQFSKYLEIWIQEM